MQKANCFPIKELCCEALAALLDSMPSLSATFSSATIGGKLQNELELSVFQTDVIFNWECCYPV